LSEERYFSREGQMKLIQAALGLNDLILEKDVLEIMEGRKG
jgi:hypothetical protein